MAKKNLISVVMYLPKEMPYELSALKNSVESVMQSTYQDFELLLVDGRETDRGNFDFLTKVISGKRRKFKPIVGEFANRAAMFNAALAKARGEYVLNINNFQSPVLLKRSALDLFRWGMIRSKKPGLVYADYEIAEEDGSVTERKLLDWHPGRLRDESDHGVVWMLSRRVLKKIGGADENYNFADLYDLRLKVSELGEMRHIGNRWGGSLYTVLAQSKKHDVFSYLLAGKNVQLEMERALTEHLKRIGAYLAPGQNYHRVEYTPEEEAQFSECIASVVIPVYNRPEFIGHAIESVLAQTVKNIEVIVVVNGGADDPTIDAVRRYMPGGDKFTGEPPYVRLIVVDINNIGYCLNSGLAVARGKYYVQLDSDDRLTPDAVEKIIKAFESDPTAGMVIGSYEVWQMDDNGEIHRRDDIPVVTHDEWTYENGRNNLLRVNGAGAPRSAHIKVFKEMGWFDVNDSPWARNYGEDYAMVLRVSEKYNIARIWEPIYKVIRHKGSTDHAIDQATIDRNDEAKDFMRLEALKRRQALVKQLRKKSGV
ncbi:glycosyltransferase [Candidatus Sumerlaeota bacterium]|nr:glycosyltransferase [Candidatus Sumerlaeota bacterium]